MPELSIDPPQSIEIRDTAQSERQKPDVIVRVKDAWLRIAVVALLEQDGYRITQVDRGDALVVCDDEYTVGARVTRLIDDRAGSSQAAINALLTCEIGGLVSKTNPNHLLVALEAITQGMFAAPHLILDSANSVPALTAHQARVLNCVGAGMSNPQIAQQLHVSVGIVKKTVSDLRRIFDVNSRVDLAMSAKEIGYRPKATK